MFLTAAVMLLPILLPKTHAAQAKVRLNKTSIHMVPGYTLKLKVKGTKAPVTWRSKKKRVATVDENGVVTGKKPGSCKIIARVAGKKLTCKVRVYNPGDVVNTEGGMLLVRHLNIHLLSEQTDPDVQESDQGKEIRYAGVHRYRVQLPVQQGQRLLLVPGYGLLR